MAIKPTSKRSVPLWAGAYPPGVALALETPAGSVPGLLAASAKEHPSRTALNFLGCTTTYAETWGQVKRLAAALQKLGVVKGTRIGLCMPNCPMAVISYYAVLLAGGVVVNLNPLYTEEELAAQITDSAATHVITPNLAVVFPKLANLRAEGKFEHLLVTDFPSAMPWYARLYFKIFRSAELATVPLAENIHRIEDMLAVAPSHPKAVKVQASDLAVLQYTGGTTGTPKAAMLSHGALLANTEQIRLWLGEVPPEGDVYLAVLPLFHCFAMTVCMNLPIANASLIVLIPQFNLKRVLATLKSTKATIVPGVPSLFAAFANSSLAQPKHFTSIRYGVSGGGPLPLDVRERFEQKAQCRLMEGYGLTEASPVATCNPRHLPNRAGSAGIPLPGTSIAIHHPKTGKPVSLGETGELWVKGPQLMDGYLNRPKENKATLVKGWLRTGDLGHITEDGYLILTDRLKDMIIVNGFKVYPRQVEEVLYRHPAIAEAVVIGIPDKRKGEVAKAFVVLKDGNNEVTSEGLAAYAKQHLSPYQTPAEIEIRTSLPKTLVGKLSKKELRAEELAKHKK